MRRPETVLVPMRARGPFLVTEVCEDNHMPTDAKRTAIAALTELLRSSSALAVADYRGLKVSEMSSVRRSLRANGVQLHVAKNRLLKIAAAEAGRAELTSL